MIELKQIMSSKFLNRLYLGEESPQGQPRIFAPGIISTHHHEHSAPAFSPDGTEIMWSLMPRSEKEIQQVIMYLRFADQKWSIPQTAPFSGKYTDGGPIFSPDGNRIFFYSNRPLPNGVESNGPKLWTVERNLEGWGNLTFLSVINQGKIQASPSISTNMSLYFIGSMDKVQGNMGIYVSEYNGGNGGNFSEPRPLPEEINSKYHDWTPFISPDERFMIFSSNRPGAIGDFDLYISHRIEDNGWTNPQNLGSLINTSDSERFPGMSPDGKFLFFTRGSDVYWVEADFLKDFSP
ncbi:MAG: hypothetical protein ACTSYU_00195 [Promethearchaeota archaeon]